MNDYIALYCERVIYGLWSEPLNAVSNLAFFGAAWAMMRLAGGLLYLSVRALMLNLPPQIQSQQQTD